MGRRLATLLFLFLTSSCTGWDTPSDQKEPWAPSEFEFATVTGAVAPINHAVNNIHEYADECMCQLGGRKAYRMPNDIVWNGPNTHEVYVYWNRKRITWGVAGKVEQFLFDGKPAAKDYPEKGVMGPLLNPSGAGLKCDHAPFVETSCLPGQRLYQRNIDGVLWTAIFRRIGAATLAAKTDGVFNEFDEEYFKVVDVQAWKVEGDAATEATGGVCWFDSLGTQAMTIESNARTAPGRPKPVPRPGGRAAGTVEGAKIGAWFDSPADMLAGDCGNCHGNSPMLGSDWLRRGLAHTGGAIDFGKSWSEPYWNTWDLLSTKVFFTGATKMGNSVFSPNIGTACDDCHLIWAAKSGTTPGGAAAAVPAGSASPIAEWMTSEYSAIALYSRYRLQLDDYEKFLALGDAPAVAKSKLKAGITHAMPRGFKGTEKDWADDYEAALVDFAKCNLATEAAPVVGGVTCTGVEAAKPPTFYGAHEPKPAVAGQVQLIQPPDNPLGLKVTKVACDPAKPPPKDKPWEGLCYRIYWQDPTDEWTAPMDYYLTMESYKSTDAAKTAGEYCPPAANPKLNPATAYDAGFPKAIGTSPWRKEYQITKPLDKCTSISVRVCGGWCQHLSKSKGAIGQTGIRDGCEEEDTSDTTDSDEPDIWEPDIWEPDIIADVVQDIGPDATIDIGVQDIDFDVPTFDTTPLDTGPDDGVIKAEVFEEAIAL